MTIGIAGDWHGNGVFAQRACEYAQRHDVTTLFHCGDLAGGLVSPFYTHLNSTLERLDMHLYFVAGNHDTLDELEPYTEPTLLYPHIEYLPPGSRVRCEGYTILGLGGAASVQDYKKPGRNWWPDLEILSGARAVDIGKDGAADIVIAHDGPNSVALDDVLLTTPFTGHIGLEDMQRTAVSRLSHTHILHTCRPSWFFHGHYHRRYDTSVPVQGTTKECHVVGLGSDHGSLGDNIWIIR